MPLKTQHRIHYVNFYLIKKGYINNFFHIDNDNKNIKPVIANNYFTMKTILKNLYKIILYNF